MTPEKRVRHRDRDCRKGRHLFVHDGAHVSRFGYLQDAFRCRVCGKVIFVRFTLASRMKVGKRDDR